MPADAVDAVRRLVDTLDSLNILYAVGGSFASSIYGVHRLSADCDLVAHLRETHVEALAAALQHDFYADADMMRDAVQRRGSFNVIHLEAVFKIDIFLPRNRPYDEVQIQRRVLLPLAPESSQAVWFVSPEDCILTKLEWYRLGHELSERQWADVLGVLKVQSQLDLAYLRRWADELGLDGLLDKALREAHAE